MIHEKDKKEFIDWVNKQKPNQLFEWATLSQGKYSLPVLHEKMFKDCSGKEIETLFMLYGKTLKPEI